MRERIVFSTLLIFLALPAAGEILDNTLTFPISLLGGVTGELGVTLENAESLTADALGVSIQLVPFLDPSLASRLPAGVSVPLGFPVLARIEPPPAGGLSFTGPTSIQMVAVGLLAPPSNLRLFSAPLGGSFQDVTTSMRTSQTLLKPGTTYRVIGSTGGFSEFLIVSDPTPVDQVVAAKLNRLDAILAAHGGTLPAAVQADLAARLGTVRSHAQPGDEDAALQELEGFIGAVTAQAGTDIPDLWRSARDRVNVAGQLCAAAKTLQYSLRLRQGAP